MACSKLISENLFKLTNEIIQYLQNYYKTLHSCVLFYKKFTTEEIKADYQEDEQQFRDVLAIR
ncbi:hypothetical protein C1645_821696 [Glomus cerebriforme]|uniref:Uncharacterized protein n=1 Tax=Glomus cerebriforme TaxID=658196 RepID=A0A397T1J4_9GLOM|nr:hypothetical protein C1645_821696 [Glomus cerebriforme]